MFLMLFWKKFAVLGISNIENFQKGRKHPPNQANTPLPRLRGKTALFAVFESKSDFFTSACDFGL